MVGSSIMTRFLLLAMAFMAVMVSADQNPLTVDLGYTKVTGKYQTPFILDFTSIKAYLGIPFAQPPLGNLRLRPPQPIDTTPQPPVTATKMSPQCMQSQSNNPLVNYVEDAPGISEDCLTLNIWTPKDAKEGSTNYPVLVWVYGGSFDSGGAVFPLYDGQFFVRQALDDTPVIVVTFNYRITAFGESAGAIALGAQLIASPNVNPPSGQKPMFDRVILESGSAQMRTVEYHQKDFDAVVAGVNCTNAANKLDCLRALPADVLLGAYKLQDSYHVVIDGTYIPQSSVTAFKSGYYQKVPMILGTNTDEGTFFETGVNTTDAFNAFLQKDYQPFVDQVKSLYPLSSYQNSTFRTASEIFADRFFVCPGRNQSDTYALSNPSLPVYKYRFNHQPYLSKLLAPNLGVFHLSEVPFVFGYPLVLAPLTNEHTLSRIMQSYWARFAATGDPNGGKYGTVKWPLYVPDLKLVNGGGVRLLINDGDTSNGGITTEVDDQKVEVCQFWMQFLEQVWETPATYTP
ncbi:hypothetical protein HDU76_006979 [Blyttiomyces sp. JEL0837]|nr:hypothetical protein HDU76_006979 [Blyttiomyces sp. JEL0837]